MIRQSGETSTITEGRTKCVVNGSSQKTSCSSSPLKNKSPPTLDEELSLQAGPVPSYRFVCGAADGEGG